MRDYNKYKPYLKDYVNSITTISPKNKSNYICPLCGSGKGENGTGAFSLKGNLWHCFSCNEGGDIFDLYARLNNCDISEAYKGIEAMYEGIPVSEKTEAPTQEKDVSEIEREIQVFYEILESGTDMGLAKEYFNKRGISDEAIKHFKLGYNGRNAIIPYNNTSYLERGFYGDFKRNTGNVGTMDATHNEKGTLFICEGWADAISLWELGFNAISVNSTNNYERAISFISGKCYKNVVIAFDNDKPGKEASSLLLKALYEIGMPCVQFDYKQLKGNHKDINEYLNDNKEELREVCNRMALEANSKAIEAKNDNKETITQTSNKEALKAKFEHFSSSYYLKNSFVNDLKESKGQIVSSGYSSIDREMGGGLAKGLYIIGAVSSLGKTTFVLNMSVNIAKQKRHVLFFSLEMDEMEMNAKTIALTIASKKKTPIKRANSIGAKEIMSQKFKTEEELQETREAVSEIENGVGNYLHFIPCNFDMNIETIQKNIEDFISAYNTVPVVVIDYLQIIPPTRPNASDKQNIDEITRNLKIIQSKYNMIMFVISSFNRESYLLPCDRTSFKESGTLEYSANVMWGLQLQAITSYKYKNMGEKEKTKKREIINNALKETPRMIKLVCLKNRFGSSYFESDLVYYNNCDYIPDDTQDHYKGEEKRKRE